MGVQSFRQLSLGQKLYCLVGLLLFGLTGLSFFVATSILDVEHDIQLAKDEELPKLISRHSMSSG